MTVTPTEPVTVKVVVKNAKPVTRTLPVRLVLSADTLLRLLKDHVTIFQTEQYAVTEM
jgi:hypothetical protein